MQLDLSNEQIGILVSAAIVEHLKPEQREKIIAEAVQKLLKPDTSGKTEIHRIFVSAVEYVAAKIVREQLEGNTLFNQKVQELVTAAYQKLVTDEKAVAAMTEKITVAIGNALCGSRY